MFELINIIKANRLLGFLRRTLHHCPPHLKEHAYKQIVLPSIEYCSSIWDPHQQSLIHKLEMIQHRAARFVLNRPWRRNHRDSITEMLVELKWPTLEDRRKQARLMLLFKFVNKLIYVPNQYLPVLSPATSTRANHPLKLLQLYARTNRYSNSFLPRSIPDWNNLDMEDLDNIDLLTFKNHLQNA